LLKGKDLRIACLHNTRYALEGNESMMVAIDQVFAGAANSGVENIVIGMPHRGRLNFLVGLLKYPASNLFWKVKGNSELPEGVQGIGDVLSHIGKFLSIIFR
jgi:probable 2-oxoglutarate dehydrogenase E1 component DHKTD1